MAKKFNFLVLLLILISGCGGDTKEELLQEGMKLVEKGNLKGSVVLFKNALEKDPDYFLARYELAKVYLRSGIYQRAEREFHKIRSQGAAFPELSLEMAELYLLTGKPDQAIDQVRQFLEHQPETSIAADLFGQAHLQKEEFATAEEWFRRGMRLDRNDASPRLHLAGLLMSRDPAAARALLQKLLKHDGGNKDGHYLLAQLETSQGNYDQALRLYHRLSEIDPADPFAAYMTGLFVLQLAGVDEAEKIAENLLERWPKLFYGPLLKGLACFQRGALNEAITHLQISLQTEQTPVAYSFLGLSYYRRDNLELALNQFQKLIDHWPDSNKARLMVATILLRQQRVNDAITEVNKVLQLDPENGTAYSLLGSALMTKGKPDEAIMAFDRAIQVEPRLIDVHLQVSEIGKADVTVASQADERQADLVMALDVLQKAMAGKNSNPMIPMRIGGIHEKRGELEQARQAYENLLKNFNGYYPALFALGTIADRQGHKQEAERLYREALEHAADFAPVLNNLAYLLVERGSGREALDLALQAYRAEPENPGIADTLGYVLLKNGRAGEACQLLEKALYGLPENPTVHYHLALSYREAGKEREANEMLNKALALGDFPEREQARDLLNNVHPIEGR